jgi:hypothetical protein
MELEKLIEYGLEFYIDDNNNVKEIDNTFLNKPNIELEDKKWFFSFFNNFNQIHDKNYNDKIEELKSDSNIIFTVTQIEKKLKLLKIYIKNYTKKKDKDEFIIKKLIKEKSSHFFPNELEFEEDDNFEDLNYITNNNYEKFKNSIINNNLDYFENDENFNFYFTYQEIYYIDFNLIIKMLDNLKFKTYNKVIYIDENKNAEKTSDNPFKNLNIENRVIKFYNTLEFNLYEPVESWFKYQNISTKFKNQKKLLYYLDKIIFYTNTMNMFFRFEDLKKKKICLENFEENRSCFEDLNKKKIMLNLFLKNNFTIDDNKFKFEGNFKDFLSLINDYIDCEINNEKFINIEKNMIKSIYDFRSYILPKIINSQNNEDLHLLHYYINNPKNNEYILISLLNKYKNII